LRDQEVQLVARE
jgi:hypothetical protein